MLFGVAGQKRMGKDTLAALLSRKTVQSSDVPPVAIRHFADAVKDMVCKNYDVTREFVDMWKDVDAAPEGFLVNMRTVLQDVGTVFRKARPTVWIDFVFRDIPANAIIADVRYENEIRAIRARGGCVILVGSRERLNQSPHPSECMLRAATEWFLDNAAASYVFTSSLDNVPPDYRVFDVWVRNDSSLDALSGILDTVLATVAQP